MLNTAYFHDRVTKEQMQTRRRNPMSAQVSAASTAQAASAPPASGAPHRNAPKQKQRSPIAQLLDFAGGRKPLTYVGCALSAISMLVSFAPYVCIWLVARDLIAVAPELGRGQRHCGIRLVGARVLGAVHPAVLRGAHVHASGGVPLRVEHAQADHRPPHARVARLLRHARLGRAAARGGRLRGGDGGAARPQAARHGGFGRHGRGHARACSSCSTGGWGLRVWRRSSSPSAA